MIVDKNGGPPPGQVVPPAIDLRLGRYEDVLGDVTCDALIVDAPYSSKTHGGHDGGVESVVHAGGVGRVNRSTGQVEQGWARRALSYSAWTAEDVAEFVRYWHPRTRGWFVSITDTELMGPWAEALESSGRYVFSPVAFVAPGSRVRLTGDGPAQWSCWIVVARPSDEPFRKWGALPGAYVLPRGQDNRRGDDLDVIGGKPLWLMQALVRDYSRKGEIICDPCAGGGTTLLAAAIEGRRAVGAEMLPEHFDKAQRRLARGYTPTLFG